MWCNYVPITDVCFCLLLLCSCFNAIFVWKMNYCRRIDMIGGLEKMANLDIPKDLSSDAANEYLVNACTRYDVKCPPPQTTARLLDKVCHWLCLLFLVLRI